MTNYNDGKWHGWSGGECPENLDPLFEVQWKNSDGDEGETLAGTLHWDGGRSAPVIAFRVTKTAPPKPREWWGVNGSFTFWPDRDSALKATGVEPFCVREVLE